MNSRYSTFNNIFGFLIFIVAATVYFKTMEPTVSFWDCGEFIASAYRLQVGHQPGAPLFLLLGKLFSLAAADQKSVAFMTNSLSVLCSAATITFLFWTITALAKKLLIAPDGTISNSQATAIFGAGAVGALAYTFSDTFWFSAVESEVYALSSLITAITFWAILKWESKGADKWLVLIAYVTGLSIGVHLLNLLAIPAITLVYYHKRTAKTTLRGTVLAFLSGCALLGCIQFGVILYLVKLAFYADLFVVNTFHLPFGSGAAFFVALLAGGLTWGILYSLRTAKPKLNLAFNCLAFILLGYSSYAMIMIRAKAKTPINISNPDNMFSLFDYLGRGQYGTTPLLYGNYFDAQVTGSEEGKAYYRKGKDSYLPAGTDPDYTYDRNTLFPRIYSQRNNHPQVYRNWLGLSATQQPGFLDNLRFLTSYQAGHMYLRYFLWNFAGKQNDNQGQGEIENGNWLTGIKTLDALRLGNQQQLPQSTLNNNGYNRFYGLPFLLGLAGLIYQVRKRKKDALVLGTLFFFTGLAIVLYLNMDPMQVRERDYVFAGSFYTFSIWIGLGVLAVRGLLAKISSPVTVNILALSVTALSVPFLMGREGWNDHDRANRFTARDMAANYLNSCAPNAILFTNADNDTYPLWYAQHVEGIRQDVRIVNLQLVYDASYITALKTKLFKASALPVTMPDEKYARGTRDYLPYVDYGLKDSVELKDVLDVMLSDNEQDKVEMRDGSRSNFLPSKKWKLSVDPDAVMRTGTLARSQKNQVERVMEWNYNKDYVTRADLAVLDILVHNQWKRPVYFTIGLGDDSYMGLDNYLYTEGFAYRLLPLKKDATAGHDKTERSNSAVMENNLLHNFQYSFNRANYLDPESRHIAEMTWGAFNSLAANLADEGHVLNAKRVMDKALASLPLKNYSLADTVNKYGAATNYYRLGENEKANQLLKNNLTFLGSELHYYASLDETRQQQSYNAVQRTFSILQACRNLAVAYRQKQLAEQVDKIYADAQKGLVFTLRS